MQGREHFSPLMLVQQGELDEQLGEPGRFHDPFPIEYDTGWTSNQLSSSILVHS